MAQTVSSEFCIAEKGSLLGVRKKAMSTGPAATLLYTGIFLETQHILGMCHALLKYRHLRALMGFSCSVSSYKAQRASKPLKYDKQ